MARLRYLRAAVTMLLIGASFYYVVARMNTNWSEIIGLIGHWDSRLLTLSSVLLIAALALSVWTWWMSLLMLGYTVPYRRMFQAWAIPNMTKYVPGGIWVYAGSMAMLMESQVNSVNAAASIGLVQLFIYSTGVVVSFPLLLTRELNDLVWIIAIGLVLGVVIVVLRPQLILALLRALGRGPSECQLRSIQKVRLQSLKALIGATAYWLLIGLAFWVFVRSMYPLDGVSWTYLAMAFAASQTAGFLVLVAPAGLGVREAVMTALLSQVLSPSIAALVALSSRIWFVGVEVICLLLAVVDVWYCSRRNASMTGVPKDHTTTGES
jgi:uncharacterized membrane protein YbhN (UPF0104 family)